MDGTIPDARPPAPPSDAEAPVPAAAGPGGEGAEGLTSAEAARRLAAVGPNALPAPPRPSAWARLRATLREPMFLLLCIAAGLAIALGDLGEGLFLSLGAALSVGLVTVQEARGDRALEALRAIAEPQALALRDGAPRRLPARDLVPGDLVLLGEGDRVPADAALVGGDALGVDEAALTGESAPVTKRRLAPGEPDAEPEGEAGGPRGGAVPWLAAGTLVVRGQGVARVARTGAATRMGRLGAMLGTRAPEPSPLQRAAARLAGRLGVAALAFCALVATLVWLARGDAVEGLVSGLTLAMALLPEEFPMVLAVMLALGAARLAREGVLVRRAAAVETLGAATRLCIDKTGTLTEARMRLAALWTPAAGGTGPDDPRGAALRRLAALASAPRPTDPMDRALRAAAGDAAPAGEPLATHPVRDGRPMLAQAWAEGDAVRLAVKGAPEAVLALCGDPEGALAAAEALAAQGLRVLAVASAALPRAEAGRDPATAPLALDGLVAFEDPLRPDAAAAVATARRAGIEVAMITGDAPATALAIARAAGLDLAGGVLTGPELDRLDAAGLRAAAARVRVFARIRPEAKLRLVDAMRADGQVVAMTGDGVNDAPALEAADVGVAMGRRGTDVAREASDLVLLDDRLASLVTGVATGRRIHANLRKALTYVAAIHVPIAGLALLPLLLGWPPLLMPLHVVLLEMVVDPLCALVFEAEPGRRDAMERPPRRASEPLFGVRQVALAGLQGGAILLAALAAFRLALPGGEAGARGLALTVLVAANLGLAFADSAEPGTALFARHRRAFFGLALAAAAVVALVLGLPALARAFDVARPGPWALAAAVAGGAAAGGWFGLGRRLGLWGAPG